MVDIAADIVVGIAVAVDIAAGIVVDIGVAVAADASSEALPFVDKVGPFA
ncbi:hypothetical protein bcere0009_39990 [Bacillus cereus R309803]|nr:hypothetical protein bcere0009_39990 [Bacillus cereus R309803]